MKPFSSALWAEMLKMRRSKVPLFTAIGFSIPPLIGGLFMIILKDPARAQSMGLISAKAQLTVGVAEWATLFNLLAQATAVGGMILFSVFTAWVFGREFSDHTAKELLALPTSREMIVGAKFILVAGWTFLLTILCYLLGLVVGSLVDIPGWSLNLLRSASIDILGTGVLTILLLPFVAYVASAGKGYLPSFGWMILTVALAQIIIITGWGNWFPWSIPALFSGAAGPRSDLLGWYSYLILLIASCLGTLATFNWWRNADHTR
jgi:ABC-2 type transport system permease protein